MPAPTPADLVSNRRAAASRSQQRSQNQTLHTRRTLVPILLTLGIMLPALGGLWFCTDGDSPFRALSLWVPIALIFFGFLLLAVAMVNVFYLAHALKQADG
jgi:RsiW-degrading membrane proteinase PrsW (M82 family)